MTAVEQATWITAIDKPKVRLDEPMKALAGVFRAQWTVYTPTPEGDYLLEQHRCTHNHRSYMLAAACGRDMSMRERAALNV